jgi:head-tail adaptor
MVVAYQQQHHMSFFDFIIIIGYQRDTGAQARIRANKELLSLSVV